jgi:D-glycerate 3-kinase
MVGWLRIPIDRRKRSSKIMTAPVLSDTLISPILAFIDSLGPKNRPKPLVLGISGPQGSGKTTLVNNLVDKLTAAPHSLRVVSFSIDDIYLPHDELLALGRNNPDNKLLQHRGEPGTHDVDLGLQTIKNLIASKATKIPAYDKSKFNGHGDRIPSSQWTSAEPPFDIILFEGWCVGFQSITRETVAAKRSASTHPGTLSRHALEHLQYVNEQLERYAQIWDQLDALVWLNAQDISFVYKWRLEQEHAMKAAIGQGMTDDQVERFVDGYMPAYELYIDGLMHGDLFSGKDGREILRLDYDQDRRVVRVQRGRIDDTISWRDI